MTDNQQALTPREQQAIKTINAVLSGNGRDPASGPGAWGECGEVEVPVLLNAVARLSKPPPAAAGDVAILTMLDKMDVAKQRATEAMRDVRLTLGERLDLLRGWDQAAANRFEVVAAAYRGLAALPAGAPAAPGATAAGEAVAGVLSIKIDGTIFTLDDVRDYLSRRTANPFLEAALWLLDAR